MSSDVNRMGAASTESTMPRGTVALLVAGIVLAIAGGVSATVAFGRAQTASNQLDIRRLLNEEKGIYPNDYLFVWVGAAIAVVGLVLVIAAIVRWRSRRS